MNPQLPQLTPKQLAIVEKLRNGATLTQSWHPSYRTKWELEGHETEIISVSTVRSMERKGVLMIERRNIFGRTLGGIKVATLTETKEPT